MAQLIFLFFAVFVLGMAIAIYYSNDDSPSRIDILKRGIRVPGVIVDLKFFGLFHRFPVVRFKVQSGELLTLTSSDKVYLSEFKKGQQVEVCYLPATPQHFVIISGLDVLVRSETQPEQGPYRFAKGQQRRTNTIS